MQINDFGKPLTSKILNESLQKNFGYKLNLERFTLEQLYDARNKLRTTQSQIETNESFDSVLENHKYQKNKMFLDVINQEISEREMDSSEEEDEDEDEGERMHKSVDLKEYNSAMSRIRELESSYAVPAQWIKQARERLMMEDGADDEIVSELLIRYDLDEETANSVIKDLIITEGEEEKAELIMASKDMVDRLTSWLEDVASMKSEAMLDLLDSIRDEMGSDVSSRFEQIVRPSLDEVYSSLEKNRQQLAQAVSILTGTEAPEMMGSPPPEGEGELSGMETMEPEPAAGREMRESAEYSRRLATILSSKKK
jgi:hypothetical protein